MPRTSASCRLEVGNAGSQAQQGFTLLELLLVFGLLALLIGLVAPAGQRALDAAQIRAHARGLAVVVRGLPFEAFSHGKSLSLDVAALRSRLKELPPDWKLTLDAPLQYSPAGVASGAGLVLESPDGMVRRWRITPMTGELVSDAEPAQDPSLR